MSALAIDAAGAFTSVGLDMAQTATSLRTRLQRFAELDVEGPDREPVIGAATPFPLGEVRGLDRLVALGAPALRECLAVDARQPAPIFLAAPEALAPGDAAALLRALADAAGLAWDPAASRAVPGGRAGAVAALALADAALARGSRECYVGGVDSLVDDDALLRAIDAGLVKHTENPNGYIPGEAAAFVRVTLRPTADTLAVVRGVAVASEPVARSTGRPSSGVGLARAMRDALAAAGAQGRDIAWLVHDSAGERYDFKELALSVARLPLVPQQTFMTWDAATSVGEVGAAAGALALAWVAFAMGKGIVPGPGAMVVGRSPEGQRAAAFLSRAPAGRMRG